MGTITGHKIKLTAFNRISSEYIFQIKIKQKSSFSHADSVTVDAAIQHRK